jgi:hypothetical protein
VTGEWRKLHNEELRDLYFPPSIIRIIKSRRMRWAGQVSQMGGGEERLEIIGGKTRRNETTKKTKSRVGG